MTNREMKDCLGEIEGMVMRGFGESVVEAVRRVVEERGRLMAELSAERERWENFVNGPVVTGCVPAPATFSGAEIVRTEILMIARDEERVEDEDRPGVEADLGDLTPEFARWVVERHGVAAARVRYERRERYLPEDVQAVLRGGE